LNETQRLAKVEQRLANVLALHFDPKWGAPYWLDRAATLGLDPRAEIRSLADLPRLGFMEPADLRTRPLHDFIPRSVLDAKRELIVAQTGGTVGRPVWTAYRQDEFEEAFVGPFVVAAGHVGFPEGGLWLYIGPSGPHIIARAADAIARRTGSPTPFTVDFDGRWAKKLPADSFAADRYLNHIVEQALDVTSSQSITTLFTTPPVLEALAKRMTPDERNAVRGVHYGGVAMTREQLLKFQTELFPNAVHLSGYGNTLFGCCLELSVEPGRELRYFPHGDRIAFGIRLDGAEGVRHGPNAQRGRVVFSRLDRTMLLINVLERDEAVLVPPPASAPPGFETCGVVAPGPSVSSPVPAAHLLY